MSLGNLAESICNGNVSLDAAKQEQKKMENILVRMCMKIKKETFF